MSALPAWQQGPDDELIGAATEGAISNQVPYVPWIEASVPSACVATLQGYPRSMLARWYVIMNCWGWPSDFPYSEPPGWETMPYWQRRDEITTPCWTRDMILRPFCATLRELCPSEAIDEAWQHRKEIVPPA